MKIVPSIDITTARLKAEAERARDRAVQAALDELADQQRRRQRMTEASQPDAKHPQHDAAQVPRS